MTDKPETDDAATTRRPILIGILVGFVLAAVIGVFIIQDSGLLQHPLRRELPASASDVQDHYWSDTTLPDHLYLLRAKIAPGSFEKYVSEVGLDPHHENRSYSDEAMWLDWVQVPPDLPASPAWWDPSPSLKGTYVRQEGSRWVFAKYERGYLYLVSLSH